ncbi:MAG: hypothetical protein WCI18_03140 [Pseudomonadota bacterium]
MKFIISLLGIILFSCTTRKTSSNNGELAIKVVEQNSTEDIKSRIIKRNVSKASGLDPESEKTCSFIIVNTVASPPVRHNLEASFSSGQVFKQDLSQKALKDEGNRIVFLEPEAKIGFGLRFEMEYAEDASISAIRLFKDKVLEEECEFRNLTEKPVSDSYLIGSQSWESVFSEEAGVDGYFCKIKPENNLCGPEVCKDWLQIESVGSVRAEGYVCSYDPEQKVTPYVGAEKHCQTWVPLRNVPLGIEGYFCKTLRP